jgi:peptidoglycan hydrolase CwlO-like protein
MKKAVYNNRGLSMNCKKAIFFLLCQVAFAPVAVISAAEPNASNIDIQSQITAIDTQIQQLKNERDIAAMRAYMAGNTADQIMGRDWLGYKAALRKQTELQELVAELDRQIAELEKKKAELRAKIKK